MNDIFICILYRSYCQMLMSQERENIKSWILFESKEVCFVFGKKIKYLSMFYRTGKIGMRVGNHAILVRHCT